MATLLLTAAGTLVGGPLGGAIGALAGRRIDGAIFGSPSREGPRLKELDATTSSYGSALPRHHGVSRCGGTIIWATDLVESSESSGGKGRPSTTTYSYTVSFAVALSSRPIESIGRIWADGNLLRGAGGDLKTGGAFRFYRGHANQDPDPLIASAEGPSAPAFRGLAYAVFEDLQLGDFGNRIPALTFEIVADSGNVQLAALARPSATTVLADAELAGLQGYTAESGSAAQDLATIGQLYPLAFDVSGSTLEISSIADLDAQTASGLPPERVVARNNENGGQDYGQRAGLAMHRANAARPTIGGVRHYDPARDYQPGIQRLDGRAAAGRAEIIEFPATLAAGRAKALATQAARSSTAARETIAWRMAEIDPAIRPGRLVTLPGQPGHYRVTGWEWRERSVELELLRHSFPSALAPATDPGRIAPPDDRLAGPTRLAAFGLPWDGNGSAGTAQLFAAVTTSAGRGRASLYSVTGNSLESIGSSRGAAVQGTLTAPLGPSKAVRFEPHAALELALAGPDDHLPPASLEAIANGANQMLVGTEVLQFAMPVPLGGGNWRLEGLLRGRGGTEGAAMAGHEAGVVAVMLNDRLVSLDPALAENPGPAIAATGLGDDEPVQAVIANAALSLKPLTPVHAATLRQSDGSLTLCWTRRARGSWSWRSGVDVPLVEESESYLVGIGPVSAPLVTWGTSTPRLELTADTVASLVSDHSGETIWICQQGTFAMSDPLALLTL